MPHKIKILTLLIMINEGNIPNRFIWNDELWLLSKNSETDFYYYTKGRSYDFLHYIENLTVLDDEIELLDDTI